MVITKITVGHTIYHTAMILFMCMSGMSMGMSGATSLEFEVGSALFYVVVVAGSILALLIITCTGILCLSMVCVILRQHRASNGMCMH